MIRYPLGGVAACLGLAAVLLAGCGKKGNPLPPLRPVPARIVDLTATRTAGQIALRFTVPAANLDGSTPVAIDRVDIYAIRATTGQASPPAGQVASDQRNLVASLPVRRPVATEAPTSGTPVSALVSMPGDVVTWIDRTETAEQAGTEAMFYVVVPVAGAGRGRSGPPTPVADVPLDELPAVPRDVSLTHDETTLRATWTSSGEGMAYRVVRPSSGAEMTPEVLSAGLLAVAEFSMPVTFDREICLAVQAVQVAGPVSLVGAPSGPVCATPVDRFPPPVPGGLRVVQEGSVVVLLWEAVQAADLAGYVVLRGDGAGGVLAPLMREPLTETTYRDTTAVAGATYSYAVYAVDSAPAGNVSATSDRDVITVR